MFITTPEYDEKDIETQAYLTPAGRRHNHATAGGILEADDGVPRRKGIFAPLWKAMAWFDRFGVEARGIERVPEDDRPHTSWWDNGTLWFSVNSCVGTFSVGYLGHLYYGMGLRDAALTIVFFNLLSCAPVAYMCTFGKELGLPLTPSRSVLLAMNTIGGVSCWRAISTTHQIPVVAAAVVLTLLALIVSFCGYKFIHLYEKFAGYPVLIAFLAGAWGPNGPVEAAGVLTFGCAIVGYAIGWVGFAADFTVSMPKETSTKKLFWVTFWGLTIPLIFIELMGALAVTTFSARPDWEEILAGGFGKFLLVILGLSTVAVNTPNVYIFTNTFHALSPYCQAIPRPFIALIVSIIYAALAAAGADSFSAVLEYLLLFLAYWLAMYFGIVATEHLVFRKNSFDNYAPDDYTNWRMLPLGVAGFFALGLGWTGAALGMNTSWFIGPIAKRIGGGGDVGFELAFGFAVTTFIPLRYFEKKYWGH
ncbi:cytosine-purine permease [Cryptococcus neoformans]|nr:cytosine-purine permease [Cryptococcus neoformans var. grubii AD1-7a]OXH35438.1 cytosine-purine permease [Cryptococcus neoformans var. grubii]